MKKITKDTKKFNFVLFLLSSTVFFMNMMPKGVCSEKNIMQQVKKPLAAAALIGTVYLGYKGVQALYQHLKLNNLTNTKNLSYSDLQRVPNDFDFCFHNLQNIKNLTIKIDKNFDIEQLDNNLEKCFVCQRPFEAQKHYSLFCENPKGFYTLYGCSRAALNVIFTSETGFLNFVNACNKSETLTSSIINSCKRFYFLTVELPNGLTKIPDKAFSRWGRIACLKIPQSVTSVGNFAFYDTEISNQIDLPSVKYIGEKAFSLSNVKCLGNLQKLGRKTFSSGNLNNLIFYNQNISIHLTDYKGPDDGRVHLIFDKQPKNIDDLIKCKKVYFPKGIKKNERFQFYLFPNLREIILPESTDLKRIGKTVNFYIKHNVNALNKYYFDNKRFIISCPPTNFKDLVASFLYISKIEKKHQKCKKFRDILLIHQRVEIYLNSSYPTDSLLHPILSICYKDTVDAQSAQSTFVNSDFQNLIQQIFPEGMNNDDEIDDLEGQYSDYKGDFFNNLTKLIKQEKEIIKNEIITLYKDQHLNEIEIENKLNEYLKEYDLFIGALVRKIGQPIFNLLYGPNSLKACLLYEQNARQKKWNQNQIWAVRKMAILIRIATYQPYDDLVTPLFACYFNDNVKDFSSSAYQFRLTSLSKNDQDVYLESLIRDDLVTDFISAINRNPQNLNNLNFNGLSFYEYCSAFGAKQILQWAFQNGYQPTKFQTQSSYLLSLINHNAEMVHTWEDKAAELHVDLSEVYESAYVVAKSVGFNDMCAYLRDNKLSAQEKEIMSINFTNKGELDPTISFPNLRTICDEESSEFTKLMSQKKPSGEEEKINDDLFDNTEKYVSANVMKDLQNNQLDQIIQNVVLVTDIN